MPRAARFATSVVFLGFGVAGGTWASRVPAVKHALGLTDTQLGLALVGAPLGTLMAMAFVGQMVARYGSRRVSRWSFMAFCGLLLAPLVATSLPLLFTALLIWGFVGGLLDTSINAHAVMVERVYERPIMSTFHAYFSMGALLGGSGGALASQVGLSVRVHFAIVTATALVVGMVATRLLAVSGGGASPAAAKLRLRGGRTLRWNRSLALIGMITFAAFASEGAAADWSAVYLRDDLRASPGYSVMGFVMFSIAIAGGRLFGDRATARLGGARLLRYGGSVAAVGLGTALLVNVAAVNVVGWALVGLGVSCAAPIAFSAAGNLHGVGTGSAIAVIGGVGYTGMLLGPPIIGAIAGVVGLRGALFVPVALCALLAAIASPAVPSAANAARH